MNREVKSTSGALMANLVADVVFELTSVEGLTYKRSEAPAPMGIEVS